MNFTDTRSRTNDPDTSKEAAKAAKSEKSADQRLSITGYISWGQVQKIGWTAKELAKESGIELADVYRRLPECAGIKPHETLRRDGCRVWVKS
jgi:hypothetical protein